MKPIGKYMREHRESAGLTQRQLADKMNYETPQFVSNWEREVSHPPVKDIPKIAKLLNVSAVEMFEVVKANILSRTSRKLDIEFRGAK